MRQRQMNDSGEIFEWCIVGLLWTIFLAVLGSVFIEALDRSHAIDMARIDSVLTQQQREDIVRRWGP